ncbi:MAG TPA: 2'-5' RNA ligase family protein, partial [Bryobacteraceae bacterium]|nr:2'-5' RNA ligase family protein [Bryobacteraceae bacterium]
MDCGPGSRDRINSFALVSYVPGRLGEYLDRLRRELVAGCTAHSHVTVLPPRPLSIGAEEAASVVRNNLEHFPTFSVEITGVRVFSKTDVIYIDIGSGRADVIQIHDSLNRNSLAFEEPYKF